MSKGCFALLACLLALPLQATEFAPLDRNAARQLLDPANHRQPTVVTLWSADCSYCKKNLQLLSSLRKNNKQLKVISIAAEAAGTAQEQAIDRYALPEPHYAYGADNPEAIAYAIDPDWAGELPRTFLFDGHGHLEKVSGVISVGRIEKATGLRFQ
ncbi:MAG: hypothetical protein H6R15_3180 [Proteobacteria bacterium]|nr:hypothetical protein [Pseudomonadota bacterium]